MKKMIFYANYRELLEVLAASGSSGSVDDRRQGRPMIGTIAPPFDCDTSAEIAPLEIFESSFYS